MEKPAPNAAQWLATSTSKKRSLEESDGYDKELILSSVLKKKAAPRSQRLAKKFKFFKCSLCNNSNAQSANVKKHILRKHYAEPHAKMKEIHLDGTIVEHAVDGLGTEYTCTECGKSYRDIHCYKKHLKNKNHLPIPIMQEKQADNTQLPIAETPLTDPIALEAQLEAIEFTPEEVEELLAKCLQQKA
jgi:transcription elongation factor Elf1